MSKSYYTGRVMSMWVNIQRQGSEKNLTKFKIFKWYAEKNILIISNYCLWGFGVVFCFCFVFLLLVFFFLLCFLRKIVKRRKNI